MLFHMNPYEHHFCYYIHRSHPRRLLSFFNKLNPPSFQIEYFQKPQIKKTCMRVTPSKNYKEGINIDFEQTALVHQNNSQTTDTDMKHFLNDIETLNLPEIKNQPQIEKIKKRIEAFAKQYGEKTEKTTSIFMNYLETVRETGVSFLRNHDLLKAASYFAECLRFVDPKYDEIFYQKFLIVKIDAVNKLMYCLFELQGQRGHELLNQEQPSREIKADRYHNAQKILDKFLLEIHQFQKIESLKKSQNCMLEVNYFYSGRLARKNGSPIKAISAFNIALELIQTKLYSKHSARSQATRKFWMNLRVKIYYKLSKCYREKNESEQQIRYEDMALKEAARIQNKPLEYYIRRKVQFYQAKMRFKDKLNELEGKKRIEEEVIRLIEDSKQRQIQSLYNVYNFQTLSRGSEVDKEQK